MDSRNRVLTVSVSTDDTKALAVMGRALLELAGESVLITANPMSTDEVPPAPAAEEEPPANVDTAAVFGGAAAPPAAVTPPPTVELDKSGLPWDAAINTSNRAQTAKKIWKRVPKISDEDYQAGLSRLRMTMAATVPTPPAPAPAAPAAPAPPADEVAPATYAQLLGVVAKHIKAGTVTHEEVNNVCAMAGLPDLNAVSARPEFVPSIYEGCKAIWATRG